MDAQDKTRKQTTGLNLDSQTRHGENNVSSLPASGDQFSVTPGNIEQDSQATPLSELAMKQIAHVVELQKSYTRACLDPDQITAGLLLRQSVQDLKNNYGRDVMVEYYGDNPEHSDTSVQDLKNNYGRDVMVEYYGDNPEHSDTSLQTAGA
ncbi:hypothetical protein SEVIR_1G130501v4 [Setaria viridis]